VHEFAIAVAKVLRERRPRLRLSLTGISQSTETWADGLGWVSEEEKNRLLRSASVLLVPSLFEGQPLVVIEALASGLPVLASDSVHSIPDLVRHAKYQDVEDWVEKLDALLEEEVNQAALSESVSSHRIGTVNEQWHALYNGLSE
jgi:glycosyltransferase involved in cell wall biosynthesis